MTVLGNNAETKAISEQERWIEVDQLRDINVTFLLLLYCDTTPGLGKLHVFVDPSTLIVEGVPARPLSGT